MDANDKFIYNDDGFEIYLSPDGVLKITPDGVLKIFSLKELQIEPIAANAVRIIAKPLQIS